VGLLQAKGELTRCRSGRAHGCRGTCASTTTASRPSPLRLRTTTSACP